MPFGRSSAGDSVFTGRGTTFSFAGVPTESAAGGAAGLAAAGAGLAAAGVTAGLAAGLGPRLDDVLGTSRRFRLALLVQLGRPLAGRRRRNGGQLGRIPFVACLPFSGELRLVRLLGDRRGAEEPRRPELPLFDHDLELGDVGQLQGIRVAEHRRPHPSAVHEGAVRRGKVLQKQLVRGALDARMHLRDGVLVGDDVAGRGTAEGELADRDLVDRPVLRLDQRRAHDARSRRGGRRVDAAQQEHEVCAAPEADHVEVLQLFAHDLLAVDEGAVGALEVLEPPALAVPLDAGVLAGDAVEGNRHRRGLVAAEHGPLRADVEARGASLAQARADLRPHGGGGDLGGRGRGRGFRARRRGLGSGGLGSGRLGRGWFGRRRGLRGRLVGGRGRLRHHGTPFGWKRWHSRQS